MDFIDWEENLEWVGPPVVPSLSIADHDPHDKQEFDTLNRLLDNAIYAGLRLPTL
jgi:hypothetical protein